MSTTAMETTTTETAAASENTMKVVAKDNVSVPVNKEFIEVCSALKNIVEDVGEGNVTDIPFPVIDSKMLLLAKKYSDRKVQMPHELKDFFSGVADFNTEDLKAICEWDKTYLAELTRQDLLELVSAANFLDYHALFHLATRHLSELCIGKTPAAIRAEFNIPNTFTPEEEEQILIENEWCEER